MRPLTSYYTSRLLKFSPQHSLEQFGLFDPERVPVEDGGERVDVDVDEALGGESLRRVFVDGLQTEGGKLGLIEQAGLHNSGKFSKKSVKTVN